jgi:hypothetical protein
MREYRAPSYGLEKMLLRNMPIAAAGKSKFLFPEQKIIATSPRYFLMKISLVAGVTIVMMIGGPSLLVQPSRGIFCFANPNNAGRQKNSRAAISKKKNSKNVKKGFPRPRFERGLPESEPGVMTNYTIEELSRTSSFVEEPFHD